MYATNNLLKTERMNLALENLVICGDLIIGLRSVVGACLCGREKINFCNDDPPVHCMSQIGAK